MVKGASTLAQAFSAALTVAALASPATAMGLWQIHGVNVHFGTGHQSKPFVWAPHLRQTGAWMYRHQSKAQPAHSTYTSIHTAHGSVLVIRGGQADHRSSQALHLSVD